LRRGGHGAEPADTPDRGWRVGRRTAGMASGGAARSWTPPACGPGCDIDNVRPAAIHP